MILKKPRKMIAVALSIDPELHQKAMRERIRVCDTNFSRYVRELIREDLRQSGMLAAK